MLSNISFLKLVLKTWSQVDYFDQPTVNLPKFYSSTLHSFAQTIKGNTKTNSVWCYLSERGIQCYQDFNQTLIEFEKAFLETINCKKYNFIEHVVIQPTSLTMWVSGC